MEKAASRGEQLPMATDDPIRASDADREVVVETLREAYTAGRLTLDEFDERTTAAYASRTWGDLRQLTTDLPSQPLLGTDIPVRDLALTAGQPAVSADDPDAEQDPSLPGRPRRPVAVLIPLAVWTVLVVHASIAPGAVILLIAVFVLVSVLSSIRRR
jgi:Domain of unknown function (DUF1707)